MALSLDTIGSTDSSVASLQRPEPAPRLHHHARTGGARHLYGMIRAARVDDERFGRERRRREALLELTSGIARDDDQRERERFGHGTGDGAHATGAARSGACDARPRILPGLPV